MIRYPASSGGIALRLMKNQCWPGARDVLKSQIESMVAFEECYKEPRKGIPSSLAIATSATFINVKTFAILLPATRQHRKTKSGSTSRNLLATGVASCSSRHP